MADRKPKFEASKEEEPIIDPNDPMSVVRLARLAAMKVMSVCAPALGALTPIVKEFNVPGCAPTFATDQYWRMYCDPRAIANYIEMAKAVTASEPCGTCGNTEHHPLAYVGGVICHEVWHPMADHYNRAQDIEATPGRWNQAGDCEINDDLLQIFAHEDTPRLCLPPGGCFPKAFGLDDGRIAEEYYLKIGDQEDKQKCQGKGDCVPAEPGEPGSGSCECPHPPQAGCGSGADGQAKPWDEGGPPQPGEKGGTPGMDKAEADCVRRDVANKIKKEAAQRGNMPAGFERFADDLLQPAKYDWRKELKNAVRWAAGRTYGDDCRTYRRLARRTAGLGGKVILPSTFSPQPNVSIVFDTSGSMDQETMNKAASELEGILDALNANLTVFTVDADAGPKQSVRSLRDIKFTGGGGTDMRVGIDVAMGQQPSPNVLIVLTDGGTPWPSAPLGANTRMIVCLVGHHATEVNSTPEWALTVKIEDDGVQVRAAG